MDKAPPQKKIQNFLRIPKSVFFRKLFPDIHPPPLPHFFITRKRGPPGEILPKNELKIDATGKNLTKKSIIEPNLPPKEDGLSMYD